MTEGRLTTITDTDRMGRWDQTNKRCPSHAAPKGKEGPTRTLSVLFHAFNQLVLGVRQLVSELLEALAVRLKGRIDSVLRLHDRLTMRQAARPRLRASALRKNARPKDSRDVAHE